MVTATKRAIASPCGSMPGKVPWIADAAELSQLLRRAAFLLDHLLVVPHNPALEAALALRRTGADPKALRRALRRIEELLDE